MMQHTTPAPTNLISVVLATCNRAAGLRNCLNSLLSMRVCEEVTWELICVDNNSTDDTKRVIAEIAGTATIPVTYVLEQRQGASYARNAGLRAARGEIVAMTDDDCIVDRDWLMSLWREFQSDPTLGMVGGRLELYNKEDLPISIRTSMDRMPFVPGAFNQHVVGANLAIRRSVMTTIGLFDNHFGPGSLLLSADDWDFVHRAYRAGIKILYSPDLIVYHDHGRRGARDLAKLRRAYAVGRGAFYFKHILRGDADAMRLAYWDVRRLLTRALIGRESVKAPTDNLRQVCYLARGALTYQWIKILSVVKRTSA